MRIQEFLLLLSSLMEKTTIHGWMLCWTLLNPKTNWNSSMGYCHDPIWTIPCIGLDVDATPWYVLG
jgi:hypothetical protein